MNSHALTVSRVLNIENSRFFRVMDPILDRLLVLAVHSNELY